MIEPLVWETYGNVEIREIGNENIDPITQFIIDCQHDEIVLHPRMKKELYEIFTDFYKYILSKKESLIAVDREKDELIGVVLCLVMTDYMKTWISLKLAAEESRIKTMFNLFYLMTREAHALQPPGTPMDSLLVFRVAVPRQQKGHNWKPKLLNAVMRMATCLKMRCVTYFGFSSNDQIRAQRAGMIEQYRIYYLQYIDRETLRRPFKLYSNEELCVIFFRRNLESVKGEWCIEPKRLKSSRRYYYSNYMPRKSDINLAEFLRGFRKLNETLSLPYSKNNTIANSQKHSTDVVLSGKHRSVQKLLSRTSHKFHLHEKFK